MDLTINTNRQSVNRHSDFALRMSLLKDGEPYTPTSFVMAFYVDEWDCETVYTASLIGGEFINCSISGDVISVYFDHPHFPLGTLKCRVVDKVRDINFKDGTFDTVTPITLPVEIVTGGGTDSVDVGDVTIEGSVGYMPPEGGIPKADLAPDVQTSLGKADTALQSFTETDPTVPSWAKQPTKPTYTAQEVGALPANTPIPTKTSDLTNDSGFITEDDIPEGTVVEPATAAPSMDGTAAVGSSAKYAREDHVHPHDTSKQDTITDLATIRSGAAAGATAVQPAAMNTAIQQAVEGLGGGTVESVTVGGTKHLPDVNGDVDLGNLRGQDGNSGVASADGVESVNNLNGGTTDTSSRVYVLGANQGKRLRDQIDYVYARLQAVYSALGNIAFWDGKTPIANILPDLDWGAPKHTVMLALSLTNAVVKHNGVAKSNGDTILVEEGGTLTLIVEPADGYALASVTSSTTGATVTDLGNGTYSVAITMGGSDVTLNVSATAARSPYQEPANGELVLWLDGADDNTALASKWVDRIGGIEFPISGAITRSGNHYQFAGTSGQRNALMGSVEDLIFAHTDHTVEVVFKPTQNDEMSIVCAFAKQTSDTLNGLYFSLNKVRTGESGPYINGMYLDGTTNVWKATEYVANSIYCFGVNKVVGLQNGTALSSLGKMHWTYSQGGRWIGGAENDNVPNMGGMTRFVGDIYAVRIYRGQLTAAQMLHNQKIDNERYGLGLTLPDSVS